MKLLFFYFPVTKWNRLIGLSNKYILKRQKLYVIGIPSNTPFKIKKALPK